MLKFRANPENILLIFDISKFYMIAGHYCRSKQRTCIKDVVLQDAPAPLPGVFLWQVILKVYGDKGRMEKKVIFVH